MATGYSNNDVEEFVRLLLAHERRIFAYILSLVPNRADADDLLQETSIVLWRKFGEYKSGSDFLAWALTVAFNVVRSYRAKASRCRLKFDDELLTLITNDVQSMSKELDAGRIFVTECLDELSEDDRMLLTKRYQPGVTIKSLAVLAGRSVEGLYKTMRRIHDRLYDCVQRKLKAEGVHVRNT